jgi:hypothetical protein
VAIPSVYKDWDEDDITGKVIQKYQTSNISFKQTTVKLGYYILGYNVLSYNKLPAITKILL